MKNYTLILILNVLLLQGCGIFGGGDNASNTPNQTIPTPTPENTTPEQQIPEDESDILGKSDGTGTNRIPLPSGLIPSINPQNRQAEVTTGKSDPFALTPVQPIINYQSTNPTEVLLSQDISGQGSYCARTFDPGSSTYVEPEPPEPLQPIEAKSVLVSGVLNLEGESVAIIKTGEYDYSYSVTEGSSIYGGQVYVKNINSRQDSPSVILEQYGQQIVRRLGEPPEIPKPETEVSKSEADSGFTILEPKGPEVFGLIKGLMLTKVSLQQNSPSGKSGPDYTQPQLSAKVSGVLCNDSNQVITVKRLVFQIEDKEGTAIDSIDTTLGEFGFVLKPGKKGEFDADFDLRNRLAGHIHIKLRDWE